MYPRVKLESERKRDRSNDFYFPIQNSIIYTTYFVYKNNFFSERRRCKLMCGKLEESQKAQQINNNHHNQNYWWQEVSAINCGVNILMCNLP